MKQLTEKNKKICIIAIITIIIIAGIIVTIVMGFNKELKYSQSQSIDVYVEQEVDRNKIKNIANEVLGRNNMIETVEIYEDMVTIRAKSISEEQKNDLVNKIKENYEFKQTVEDTKVKDIPATKLSDMYKKYILPFSISGILVLIYMLVRYYKKGILKVIAITILIPIILELLLLSIIAITRIPVGRITPALVIITYILAILYVVRKNEE